MEKILVTTSSFSLESSQPRKLLEMAGFQVVTNPFGRKLNENELIALLEENRPKGLLAGTEPISRTAILRAGPQLRVISRIGVGWDNVDHDAARESNIKVFRTEGVLDQAVAELTIGMMLSALRLIVHQTNSIRQGVWKKTMGTLLAEKKVGIIGFGAIGRRVGELARAFGAEIFYFDIEEKEVPWAEKCDLNSLLEQTDIITIHADGDKTLLGSFELENCCKKDSIIINTARGGMVDENSLFEALKSGRISYACLDVFEKEPYDGPLKDLDNVLLTSHIGSYAREARIRMEIKAVENLLQNLGFQ